MKDDKGVEYVAWEGQRKTLYSSQRIVNTYIHTYIHIFAGGSKVRSDRDENGRMGDIQND